MNWGDMADFVTDELGLYDAESKSMVRRCLDKEYRILWDKYPWINTITFISVIVPGGTAFVTPDPLNRVVSVLASDFGGNLRLLDPVDRKFIYESASELRQLQGPVKYYEELADGDLRLWPTPAVDTTLEIQGKAPCQGVLSDNNSPTIRNIDGALMAYAMFDMLQRQRQYAKADLKRKEAQELEQVAWNLEQQQANQPRMSKATTVAGNSLVEMTDAVCTICGVWTPDYRLVIREFLRRNYQTLYDIFLWPESLVMVRVPYTTEQVVMPHYIDKVLGVRGTNDMRMFPADAGLILDITPSAFDEIGDPMSYTTLTPVAVYTLPAATTTLFLASTQNVDTGPVFIRGEVIVTGQELEETVTLNGTTPVTTQFAYDIPITVSKDITIGNVTVNATADGRSLQVIPANQRELKHQRLWFLPIPDNSKLGAGETFTCLVLGKRAIRPLSTSQDTPIITGAQQVLIAAAAADLFRKLEKHDMANAFQQKAGGSTDALKAKNTDQAASAPRFVPQVEPRSYTADCTW